MTISNDNLSPHPSCPKSPEDLKLGLYRVTRNSNPGWDQFSAFVCTALSPDDARHTHPYGPEMTWSSSKGWVDETDYPDYTWVSPTEVKVEYIGKPSDDITEPTIICSSYHAG